MSKKQQSQQYQTYGLTKAEKEGLAQDLNMFSQVLQQHEGMLLHISATISALQDIFLEKGLFTEEEYVGKLTEVAEKMKVRIDEINEKIENDPEVLKEEIEQTFKEAEKQSSDTNVVSDTDEKE